MIVLIQLTKKKQLYFNNLTSFQNSANKPTKFRMRHRFINLFVLMHYKTISAFKNYVIIFQPKIKKC